MRKKHGRIDTHFEAIPQHVACVTLTVQELNQMSTEQRKAIQKRYPCAEQIILVDERIKTAN
ncbi:hypothetical protein [Legionella sainthelensi]|uniref:hypothetical protein n=1 Tax=Legionella sainthelensi TaxID=28087 RepID=UPI000E20970C|nr:hypothetical protein [Legionella sainthelensi]